jgi:hypothetical protein
VTVLFVALVVPAAGAAPVAGATGAGAACTSIIEESPPSFGVAGAVVESGELVFAAASGAASGWMALPGLASGAGAGELSCAREIDVAASNTVAPQTNWFRRVDIGLMEIDDCRNV